MSRIHLRVPTIAGALLGFALSCGDSTAGNSCPDGSEGCPCPEGGGCDDGLSCISQVCVVKPDASCGNGVLEGSEECDNGTLNADDAACKSNCTLQFCGDGLIGPGELCDDGNMSDLDGCTSKCTVPTCGNGVVEGAETCDDGNADNSDACTAVCLPATCGDGFLQPDEGEACDDGNNTDGDGCSKTCTQEPRCGDGTPMDVEVCHAPGPILFVDQAPSAVAIGDANADGFADIVTASYDESTVNIMFGDGTGMFAPHPPIALAGQGPVDVLVTDIDGDGYDDIITADALSDGLTVLYGTGVPTPKDALEAPRAYPGYAGISDIAAGQLLSATDQTELAIAHASGVTSFIVDSSAAADRDNPATSSAALGMGLSLSVDMADITGEGIPELFVLDRTSGQARVVAFQTGTKSLGSVSDPTPITGVTGGVWIDHADIDLDDANDMLIGQWDVASCDYDTDPEACSEEAIVLALGDKSFTFGGNTPPFSGSSSLTAGKAPSRVIPALLDGGSEVDLVVANRFSDTLDLFVGAGDGTFTLASTLDTVGHQPVGVAVGDLNGDDITDVVSVENYTNSISIFLSNP